MIINQRDALEPSIRLSRFANVCLTRWWMTCINKSAVRFVVFLFSTSALANRFSTLKRDFHTTARSGPAKDEEKTIFTWKAKSEDNEKITKEISSVLEDVRICLVSAMRTSLQWRWQWQLVARDHHTSCHWRRFVAKKNRVDEWKKQSRGSRRADRLTGPLAVWVCKPARTSAWMAVLESEKKRWRGRRSIGDFNMKHFSNI